MLIKPPGRAHVRASMGGYAEALGFEASAVRRPSRASRGLHTWYLPLAHQRGAGWTQEVVGLREAHRARTHGVLWRRLSVGRAGSSPQSWAGSLSPRSPGSDGEIEAEDRDWPGGADGPPGVLSGRVMGCLKHRTPAPRRHGPLPEQTRPHIPHTPVALSSLAVPCKLLVPHSRGGGVGGVLARPLGGL